MSSPSSMVTGPVISLAFARGAPFICFATSVECGGVGITCWGSLCPVRPVVSGWYGGRSVGAVGRIVFIILNFRATNGSRMVFLLAISTNGSGALSGGWSLLNLLILEYETMVLKDHI